MIRFYYSSCSIAAPHVGVVLDDVIASKGQGHTVYWAYCRGVLPSCFMNLSGHRSMCWLCHRMYDEYAKVYAMEVRMVPVGNLEDGSMIVRTERIPRPVPKIPEEIMKYQYRHVQLGASVLSMYYEATRDLDLMNLEKFIDFFEPLRERLCDFIDYSYTLLEKLKPDEIIIYNGRLFENRLFYDIAKSLGIPFYSLEAVGGRVEPYKKIRFEGGLPLDIGVYSKKMEHLWHSSPQSMEDRSRLAASFYEKRRQGILVGDTKVYTAMQHEGLLPDDFRMDRRNVVIFNSSQDEIAALGDEWANDTLFDSQAEAIEYMIMHADPDIHFYLRIHPNLKGVKHSGHMDLYELERYSSMTVIPPESAVSTYALLDACWKVVTFGSTTGVEACYWGKPSILIGHSFYEKTGASYSVQTRNQLMACLNGDIPPKDKTAALKYAYFLMDRTYSTEKSVIDIDVKYYHLRWNFFSTSYFRIHHSKIIFQVVFFICCILGLKFSRVQIQFPWTENS